MSALFFYHSGEQALVFPNTVTGKAMGIKLTTLAALGWKNVSHGAMLAALPRFDAPNVRIEPASRLQAVDLAMRRER